MFKVVDNRVARLFKPKVAKHCSERTKHETCVAKQQLLKKAPQNRKTLDKSKPVCTNCHSQLHATPTAISNYVFLVA